MKKESRRGPKGKYAKWLTEEGLLQLEGWAKDGLTDGQIAYNMGIGERTLYLWKKKFCEICDALKRGKEVVDRQVENSLLKRALGYSYEETTYEQTTEGLRVKKVVSKEMPGDVTAQIFWLKNRKPHEWSEKHKMQLHHSGHLTTYEIAMTPEERRERIDALKDKLALSEALSELGTEQLKKIIGDI